MADMVFEDIEVNSVNAVIMEFGAIKAEIPVIDMDCYKDSYKGADIQAFRRLCDGASFICGHNIVGFDKEHIENAGFFLGRFELIDTLYMSPIIFPKKPYHKLKKDEKLFDEAENNPRIDAKKCMELYVDEVSEYFKLDEALRKIFYALLYQHEGYKGFFDSVYARYDEIDAVALINELFEGKICSNSNVEMLVKDRPIELAYVLASIYADDKDAVIPAWVRMNYPKVNEVFRLLRGKKCDAGCLYCNTAFDIRRHLKEKFGFDSFRKFNGEDIQEKTVRAALEGKSLLAVFPTGGGKSISFQLPAFIEAETVQGLTVVIDPLQSLMKDQVDNLYAKGLVDAVSINGMLSPIERKEAIERVEKGMASLLYLSPESLRSNTIERLLVTRGVNRFVIDEAHCFSAWGQDFRVDYLYIGDFIAKLEEKLGTKIPVSCFTATAKQKVISDIKDYFIKKLKVSLELYTTDAARKNLHYTVIHEDDDNSKYEELRNWIEAKNCPTIVYVSRTKKAEDISERLCREGFNAGCYHGQMEMDTKINNQNAFKRGDLQIIVATSAFGMGVDKADVGLVVHYDISDSLENYVQEAGRAGRDEHLNAECLVLFNEKDLDKHFLLLNQTKLSISEIQQVWNGIKRLSKGRNGISSTALEIAKAAGWNVLGYKDLETKVKAAISALEMAGYVKRGNNSTRVYADSLNVKNMIEAVGRINSSPFFDWQSIDVARRIIGYLLPKKYRGSKKNIIQDEFGIDVETRVDYIADKLGLDKSVVIESVNKLKLTGIISDDKEMTVYLDESNLSRKGLNKKTDEYLKLERFFFDVVKDSEIKNKRYDYRELNEIAEKNGLVSNISMLKEIVNFWAIKDYIEKPKGEVNNTVLIQPKKSFSEFGEKLDKKAVLCEKIEEYFKYIGNIERSDGGGDNKNANGIKVDFSPIGILKYMQGSMFNIFKFALSDIEEALLYLSKIRSFRMDGGFLVIYNALRIERLEVDNKKRYSKKDYEQFEEYYKNKTRQIHIVGEYANMMVNDYDAALIYVKDYFNMDYNLFLKKYFAGNRLKEIDRNITSGKYDELFNNLTEKQGEIINDDYSRTIVVAAGPGSGKTKILVNKMASLLLLENVKYEQLIMLTFSRNAALEFRSRLKKLIGNGVRFCEIKTFHSYAFSVLGRRGTIDESDNIVRKAAEMIENDDAETDKITKTVLLIDEAQDINEDDFALILALRKKNDNMRIIAVGDDDQNINGFRGSDSKYMSRLIEEDGAKMYQMVENFRSCPLIVELANLFSEGMVSRIKNDKLISKNKVNGNVMVVRADSYLEGCLEKVFRNCYRKDKRTAILTTTNEEAYNIQYILEEKGYKVRLIQSADRVSLYDMIEFRGLMKFVSSEDGVVISDELWKKSADTIKTMFSGTEHIDNIEYILDVFDKNYEKKYCTDLENFLRESKIEDYYQSVTGEVIISTIHKAKGHEFDDVYLVLGGLRNDAINEETKRVIYVGMTRAKENLYVIQKGNCFRNNTSDFDKIGVKFYHDDSLYEEPGRVTMDLGYTDISLSFTGNCMEKRTFGEVLSGDDLLFTINIEAKRIIFSKIINNRKITIASTSTGFYEKYCKNIEKGYTLISAKVRFVVMWRDSENDYEYKIILPSLVFEKNIV